MEPYGPRMMEAMRRLDLLGRPAAWPEFAALPCTRRDGKSTNINVIRHLLKNRLVTNTVAPYQRGEPYTGPRQCMYVLSGAGKIAIGRTP